MSANVLGINRGGQFAPNERVVGLDVLRVTMALLIYMFHSYVHMDCTYGVLNNFVSVGALAMTGFYMLSGYSLCLVYGEKNLMDSRELKVFYLKRLWGIFPLYYAVALLYILFLGKEGWIANIVLFPIEILGLQSTFTSLFGFTHNGGTWFISCLVIGYLIYPYLQFLVQKLNTRQKVFLLVALIGVELWAILVRFYFGTARLYDNPFYRTLELMIGLLVAEINKETSGLISVKWSRIMLLLLSIVLFMGVSALEYKYEIRDYMLFNYLALPCFAGILYCLGRDRMAGLEKSKVLSYASKISYSFFLAQYFAWPIGKWIIALAGVNNNEFKIIVTFLISTLIAVLLYEIIQNKMVGLLKKRVRI